MPAGCCQGYWATRWASSGGTDSSYFGSSGPLCEGNWQDLAKQLMGTGSSVCVHVHVCILNLAGDTAKAPNISISVSDSRTLQVLSTRGRLSLYSTHQQNSKKKLREGEYEDFWHWRCIKRGLTEEEGFLLHQQVKTESVQERKSHSETPHFNTKTVHLVYFLHGVSQSLDNVIKIISALIFIAIFPPFRKTFRGFRRHKRKTLVV